MDSSLTSLLCCDHSLFTSHFPPPSSRLIRSKHNQQVYAKHVMGKIKPQALLLQSKKKKAPSQISLTTIIAYIVILMLIILSLYATYRNWYYRSNDQPGASLDAFEGIEGQKST